MNFYKLLLIVIISIASVDSFAQADHAAVPKTHKFAIYGGVGPNIYFNNLVLAKEYVNTLNYSFAGRIMWEPEHLLSLGIESGYYRLYSISDADLPGVKISNSAIPIQLVIYMKILKTFYVSFGSGQSILLNKVSTPSAGEINASNLSLGDFIGSFGYKKQLKERLSLSSEIKFFYSSKLNDKNIALLFMLGYKL